MTDVEIPILERPFFFDGQLLTATDLAEVQAFHRELRWLHNRALHDWGVVFGLGVGGARGDRSVQVDRGYALDCAGRDLIQDTPAVLQVPPVAGSAQGGAALYYLTASYLDDADIEPETRAGACDADGAVRRREQVRLRWQDPADTAPESRYRPGLDVVLASARILGCRLADAVSFAERREAVTVLHPYIGAGRTAPGDTAWRLWPDGANAAGVATDVSTLCAGFREAPLYQARVAGERIFDGILGGKQRRFAVDGYAHILDATTAGFTLRVLLTPGTTLAPGGYTITAADLEAVVRACLERTAKAAGGDAAAADAVVSVFIEANGLAQAGATLATGGELTAQAPPWDAPDSDAPVDLKAQVEAQDFLPAFAAIAQAAGVAQAEFVAANDLQSAPALTAGDVLVVPGSELQLNPSDVLTPAFLEELRTTLGWHTVWQGTEV